MIKYYFTSFLPVTLLLLQSCIPDTKVADNSDIKVEFIDQYIIPFEYEIDQTWVGGLSSIESSPNGKWYIISDDRSEYSPARFYEAEIEYDLNGIDTVLFTKTVFLKDRNGESYTFNTLDPEAIRFNPRSATLFYSSEGGRMDGTTSPFVREMDTLGNFLKEYNVPKRFDFYNESRGLRDNGAFESLAFENDSILWFVNELPLIEDGEVPQFWQTVSPVRLSKFDIKNNQPLAQYAYMIEAVQAKPIPEDGFNINSVVELLVLDTNKLLVMERSYIKGVGNFVKIFNVSLEEATDVSAIDSLMDGNYVAVEKETLIDFSDYGKRIDNIEGMGFGKDFPDGRKSLICVSDNNFNEGQQTQLWLFAIEGL
ncbi:esterase-like activity of phytase family protein [Marivirga sp. S37H4]|uniref:Esterase-like activity of phytase family protein n=1 Tax=Marivirga aurantiaca TaxID=2802615 RepID=A0A935C7A0_9BACT|nr:esterase-like activity of phytase family protein [Marivirga aurantiaca]MBK6264789.1 esterase-like activity of phytase family protein [Marivirga aurantiaca]